jgi:serine protease Do
MKNKIVGLLFAILICSNVAFSSELRDTPLVKAIQRVRASVVDIQGEKPTKTGQVNGMGTGVVIDSRGYILTNYHVVDGIHEIFVFSDSGQKYIAKLIAHDDKTDLAIIKVDAALPVIPIGTSSDLMAGETVIAIGNAYGYAHTVTRGIISALHRSVQVSDTAFYDDLIQTDASINAGNSGGPLLNIDGNMIGVNVAVREKAQNIGFSIPIDKVVSVIENLLSSRNKAWIGVTINKEWSGGVVVGEVDGPAKKAGIFVGDVLVGIGDTKIKTPLDFQLSLLERKPKEEIILKVLRNNVLLAMKVALAEPPKIIEEHRFVNVLGLELKPLEEEDFVKISQTKYHGGLKITAVQPASSAANQGVVVGDILVGIKIWETITLANLDYIISLPDFHKEPAKFFIVRDNEAFYGYFPVVNDTIK